MIFTTHFGINIYPPDNAITRGSGVKFSDYKAKGLRFVSWMMPRLE